MKKLFTTAAAAALLAAGTTGAARAEGELVLGYLAASTGPFVSLSRTNAVAVEMAIDEVNAKGGVNGHKVKVIKFDTAGKPQQAVLGLRKLANDDKVLAIIGPFSSGEAGQVFPAAERIGIVTIPMASSAPGLAAPHSYAFRNTMNEGYMFSRVMMTLKKKGRPTATAALAYATDDRISKVMGTKVLPAVLKKSGVQITGEVTFKLAAFDLSPQVSKLMQNPSDLVAVGAPPEAAIKLVKEMRRQGHGGRIVAGSTINDPDLPEKMGEAGNGTTIPSAFFAGLNDRTKAFAAEFTRRAKAAKLDRVKASQFDAQSYSIAHILAYALGAAKVTGDPAKLEAERTAIRDALKAMRDFPALEGPITFGEDGDALKPVYILEMAGGEWKLIDTHPPQK